MVGRAIQKISDTWRVDKIIKCAPVKPAYTGRRTHLNAASPISASADAWRILRLPAGSRMRKRASGGRKNHLDLFPRLCYRGVGVKSMSVAASRIIISRQEGVSQHISPEVFVLPARGR